MTDVQSHLDRLAQAPADLQALEAIEDAYRGEGRWEELLRVYEDNASRAEKTDAGPLFRKAAMVCLNELASAPRAEAYLKRALDSVPSDFETLRALRELYMGRGDFERGLEVYERELARTTDPQAKAMGLVEVASIYRDMLQRNDKALPVLKQALRADKKNPAVHRALASVYEEQGRLDQAQASLLKELDSGGPEADVLNRLGQVANKLLGRPRLHEKARAAAEAVLEHQADDTVAKGVVADLDSFAEAWMSRVSDMQQKATHFTSGDPSQAADIWLSIAEIQLVYGEQPDTALSSVDHALAASPGHQPALRLMEEVFGQLDRFGELATKLETMAAYTRDPKIAVDLYLRAAMLNAVRLDRPDASAHLYVRVLELEPGNKVASNALAEYYRERKLWDHALQVLSVWADRATEAADKVAANYACCRILEEELGDKARARPYYEAILALDPQNQAAARALEDVYRDAGEHPSLARALAAKLSGLSGDARIPVLQEVGELYAGVLDQAPEALATLGELYQLQPTGALRERLEELAAKAGDFSSLVTHLEGGLERIESDEDRVESLHSIAALYEGARDAPMEALRIHRRILALHADDERATAAVGRLIEVAAQSGDKIAVYREQAESASSDEEKVSILGKLATELVETAKDYVRAIDVYRDILKLKADDPDAIEGLLGLYRRDNRWAEVSDMLAQKLQRQSGEEKMHSQLELAGILEAHLGRIEESVDHYTQVLEHDGANVLAITGLERLMSRSKKVRAIAERLEPHYTANNNWPQVAAMMEIRIREEQDEATRVELLAGLARVQESSLQNPKDALASLLRAFQADPTQGEIRKELERVAQVAGDFSGVVRGYRAAALVLEGDHRLAVVLRGGALAEQLNDFNGATLDYLRALGSSDQGNEAALEGLRRLLKAGVEPARLIEQAKQVVSALEDTDANAARSVLARFYEQDMKETSEAIATWTAVLEANPDDQHAREELDRLYQQVTDPAELATYLRQKMDQAGDDASRAQLALQIADVLHTKGNDVAGAIAELTAVSEKVPGQKALWRKLADLHTAQGQATEAAQAMHKEINLLPEGDERHDRLVAYAELLSTQLGDTNGALAGLQSVTAHKADHAGAIGLIEKLLATAQDPAVATPLGNMLAAGYRAAQRWDDLVNLQLHRVDQLSDSAERVAALKEVAEVKNTQQNDAAGAYQVLERAFNETPLDDSLRMQLERLAEAAGAWENLATAYQAALQAVHDEESQKPIRRKLAEVLDKRLGRGNEAVEHYKAVSGGELPDDVGSLEAMERLLREQQNYAELAEVLNAIAQKVDDEARRKTIMLELGQICEEQLADKPRAIDVYQSVVAIDPKSVPALDKLRDLLLELGQTDALADTLDKLIALGTGNPNLVEDYVARANVAVQQSKLDDAFNNFKNALMKKRDHEAAIAGLEGLIEQAEDKLDIAQVLEPLYTAKQDHAKLAWVLEKRLDGTEDKVQRKGLLRRVGDIYENRLQQRDRAFAMARRSLQEDPSDMGVRMWIEKLAGETGAMRELADAYVEEANAAEDQQLKLQFHRRAASLYHEKLDEHSLAVTEYRSILEVEERDEKSLSGLETIFRQTEDYSELVTVLQGRIGLTAGVERKREYLQEIANIQSEKLQDVAAAVETYKQILEITPDDPQPFTMVEQLLAQGSQWEELCRTYEAEEQRLAEKRGRDVAARRLEFTFRRGTVVDQQFGDATGASEIFEIVLNEDPVHANTIGYLEQRVQQGVPEAVALLEKVYSTQEQWQKYVALLEMKLTQTAETELRREVYLEIAKTYNEHLSVPDMAFQALTRAFNENRADLELLDKLQATAETNGRWEELVAVLGTDLDAVADPALRQDLLRRLGEICGIHLNDPNRAIAYLQHALQYDPRDKAALEGLDKLLEKNEMWAALADLIERRVEVADSAGEKSLLLERLAAVWGDKLMDAEAALRCHQQILEIDPDHPISLKSMQKLYAEVQDWDSLARNLTRQAEVLTDVEDQIRIHAAAGELYAEELGDMNLAIEHYTQVAELAPTHEGANQALDILLASEEKWEELAVHLRRQLAHNPNPEDKLELNRRLGTILGEKLGQTDDALTSWEDVLKSDAKNLEAMRALLALYTERAMWDQFVENARRMIPLADPAEAKEVRFQLAKALGENLGKREEAIKLGREVRATEPHTAEQMVKLANMLVNIEAFDEAVLAMEKAAGLEEDPQTQVSRWYEAADLYREKLEKPNDARTAYEAILLVAPSDGKAFAALAEVYRNTEEWRKLVAMNEEFVPHAEPTERLLILTEIRDVQDEKLGEKELAFIAACRVYKEDPTDLGAAEILERIALETDGAEEAAAVLEDELDNVVDTEVKIALYRRIARLYSDEIGELVEAESMLAKILEIEPGDLEALDVLSQLGAREERYDKQIGALEHKLGHVGEDTQRKSILYEIARIWEDRIGEMDEAISAYNRVLEIDGGDPTALDSLGRIFEHEGRYTELAHVLTRKVELSTETDDNINLRMRVAQLCEGELGDAEAAIQWYRGVLDFDPAHPGALNSLDRLYTGLERWSELVQIFELQIEQTPEIDDKIALLAKEAAIYENEFATPKDAAACYERIYEMNSSHLPSLRNLERLLKQLGEWNRLIEILEHHITLIQESDEAAELYLQIGEIYYRELSRVDKAEEYYNKAREFDSQSGEALAALGQLYERSGNWFQSLEMLQREADALASDERAMPILMRIGRINEDMLMDIGAAQNAYRRALEIDPTYSPALGAMKEIAKHNENWEEYSEYLISEAETCDDPEEQTELFVEAAEYYINVAEDEMAAIRYYNRALETTPEHYETCKALAEIYFRNEMWDESGEMYVIVVAGLDKSKDAKEFCQKHYRLGYISEKLGEKEKALEHYQNAFEADATYLPALEGLGQALLAVENWEEAQKVFQTILIHHRDALTESEVVDVQAQLGEICMQQNQPDRAYKQFEKALEIDPDHPQSLGALAKLDQGAQNWESAYTRLSRLGNVAPGPERAAALVTMSQIATDQLGDLNRAVEPLERARKGGQAGVEVLERLADLYLQTHQATKAVEVLSDAVTSAPDAKKASQINYTLASVYETEIKHEPLAVQTYNAALDADPTNVAAFEHIERILGARQEWALLEANYRAMIARSKDLSEQIRLVLWRNLGELYRQVLRSVDNAIMAYEVIQKMDPGNASDAAILAELYALKPDKRAQAIEMSHALLKNVENPVPPIRSLSKLYRAAEDWDAVFVLSNALAFMNEADDEERKAIEYLARGVPPKAQRGLLEDHWKLVKDPELDGPIGKVLTMLAKGAPDLLTVPAKDVGLKKKDFIDVRSSDLYFANMVRYVGKVLNLQGVDLYRKSGSMEPLHVVNSQPPALVAGENADIFRDTHQGVVLYHVGRNLAYSRPEMFLARIHPGDDLRDLLFGLIVIFNRSLQHNGHPGHVDQWAAAFEGLPQPVLKRLQPMVMDAYNALTAQAPFSAYLLAVENTAARAGLLAAGDLASAVRGISDGGDGAAHIETRERVKAAVLFSVSKEFLQLRKLIGAALAMPQSGQP